jgi:hypothetical protein
MRPRHLAALAALALALVVLLARRDRDHWLFGPFQRAAPLEERVAWEALPGADVDAYEIAHGMDGAIRVRARLPDGTTGIERVEVRFHAPLDGARVDAWAVGDRGWQTLLDGRRVAGDTVAIPVPPGPIDRVELTVHHHLRPLPVVRDVRFGRPPTPAAPAPRLQ